MIKKLFYTICITILASCSSINTDGSFKTKSTIVQSSNILPSSSPEVKISIDELLKAPSYGEPTKIIGSNLFQEIPKISFDDTPPTGGKVITGEITVIYNNEDKIRINKNNKDIIGLSLEKIEKINLILRNHEVKYVNDGAFPEVTDQELDQMQINTSKYYNSDVPHRKSVHHYTFSKESNINEILKEFKNLTSVKVAYPTPQLESISVTTATRIGSKSTTYGPNPDPYTGDPLFIPPLGSIINHFIDHRVFDAWGIYNAQMPKIAIIDAGFDTRTNANERPNYVNGLSVRYDPAISGSWEINFGLSQAHDVCEYFPAGYIESSSCKDVDSANFFYSHGTAVAVIAAAPKNNSTGASGIAFNAQVVPIRARNYHPNSIIHSIYRATVEGVDVINISIGLNNRPITQDPNIRSQVATAIANNIPVVIGAGNGGAGISTQNCGIPISTDFNYDPTSFCAFSNINYPNVGEIVVGGSQDQSSINKTHAWLQSTFGNKVTLTARANDVYTATFNPGTQNSTIGKLFSGTSMSTPMVAAAIGMMKKVAIANGNNSNVPSCYAPYYNPNQCKGLSPFQLKSLVTFSGNLGIDKAGYSNGSATRYLGANNGPHPFSTTHNDMGLASIRDLNVYNAVILAKNSHLYQSMTRYFNVDDYARATDSLDWAGYYGLDGYNSDEIFGINNIYSGVTLNFSTYNSGGGLAYGYQVYRNGFTEQEFSGGVVSIIGAGNNQYFPTGWNKFLDYTY